MRVGVRLELHPTMQPVLKYAERAFLTFGKREAIVTSARDREHGPGSWHYFGLAIDLRTKDLDDAQVQAIVQYLRRKLPLHEVHYEGSHIHIEIGDVLAKRLHYR